MELELLASHWQLLKLDGNIMSTIHWRQVLKLYFLEVELQAMNLLRRRGGCVLLYYYSIVVTCAMRAMLLLLLLLPAVASGRGELSRKRAMVWVYGSDLYPEGGKLETTLRELAAHTDSFNAIAPQMYSVGCGAPPPPPPGPAAAPQQHDIETTGGKPPSPSPCTPILISDSSDPGVVPWAQASSSYIKLPFWYYDVSMQS